MALSFGSHLFYKAAGYVTLALLTRYLDKPAMGQVFFAATLAGTAVVLTELGTHRVLVRRAAGAPDEAAAAVSEVLSLRLPLFAVYFAGVNAFTWLVRPELTTVMLLTSVYVALEELYLSFGSVFVGLRRLVHNAVAGVCCRLVLVGLVLVVIGTDLGLHAVLVAHIVANAVLVLLGYALLRRRLGPVRLRWDAGRARAVAAESLPMFAVGMCGLVHDKVDTVMLGLMRSYSDVAGYQAAYKVLEALRIGMRPVTTVLFPILTAMPVRAQWGEFRAYTGRALAAAGWVGAAAVLAIVAAADPIVRFAFGPGYAEAAPLLRVLVLSVPLLYLSGVALAVAQSIHRERRAAAALAVCLVANVGANLVAIPRWGPLGAAWTTVGSEALLAALLVRAALEPGRQTSPEGAVA